MCYICCFFSKYVRFFELVMMSRHNATFNEQKKKNNTYETR
jgi:hypothetical protein